MTKAKKQQRALIGRMLGVLAMCAGVANAQEGPGKQVLPKIATVKPAVGAPEEFSEVMTRMRADKSAIQQRHVDLLNLRYDLGDHPANVFGKLNPQLASEPELRGQTLFFGKAQCATCHSAPYYTDNLMHNLQVERFFKPQMINGRMASADGPIKTFPLRGIKDSPPYFHDGRLLTLDDTVEFFSLIFELKLTADEKADLIAFLRVL